MTDAVALRPDIKDVVVTSLRLEGIAPSSIEDDELLFGGRLGLDSVDALELMVALEQRFGVVLQGGDVDAKAFASVSTLADLVASKMPAGRSGD